MSIFRTQNIESISKHVSSSEKNLGTLDLTLMSIGSVIGTGVMVLTGIVAAKEAGPGVMLSFLIGGIAAAVIVLCYAELCSAIPSSGGSYTFIYTTMGEIVAYVWRVMYSYWIHISNGNSCIRLGRIFSEFFRRL